MKLISGLSLIVAIGGALTLAGPAPAQVSEGAPVPATDTTTARRVADHLHRRSTVWLRSLESPLPSDYRRAALVMGIARRLAPDDAQLLRHEISAWDAADDEARALALTRELVRLDPADTVASLRAINASIDTLQDVDKRLAAYDRLLGPQGEGIDPSIRSRLALDAALLARDTGDDRGFAERLLMATTLDVTNKDAVALQASYYLDRTSDAGERFDLLSDVVLADPLDAGAYLNLADECMRRGAFRGARRFLDITRALENARGVSSTVEGVEVYATVLWNAEGADAALKLIDAMRNDASTRELARRRQIELQGLDPGPAQPIVVHPRLERLAMLIHSTMGDPEKARTAFENVMLGYRRSRDLASDQTLWPQGTTPEQMAESVREIDRGEVWTRVLIGRELDQAEEGLLVLENADGADRPGERFLALCRGWLQFHSRQFDAARATLEPLAGEVDAARYGLALIDEAEGDRETALKNFARTALFFPESAFGAASRTRITQIRGRPLGTPPDGQTLETKAQVFAPWLEKMIQDPWSFMSIQAEHVRTSLGPLDRPELRVTVRNLSRMPLALGPSAPIDSSILLSPRLLVNAEEKLSVMRPEVLRLNQRLRLMPGETFRTTIWTNYGWIGALYELAIGQDVMLRWRLVQGFVARENGAFEPGPLCLTVQSDMIRRANLDGDMPTDELVAWIASADGSALTEAVALAATRLVPAWKNEEEDEAASARTQEDLARAVGVRFGTMNEWQRTLALCRLADATFFRHPDELLVELVAVPAQASDSVWSMAAYLMAGPRKSDDPVIQRAMAHPDPALSELASLVHTALRGQETAEGGAADDAPDAEGLGEAVP